MERAAPPPALWRGINLRTAEDLRFAATSQLLRTYRDCLRLPVTSAIIHAWLLGPYQGQLSPDGMPNGQGSVCLFGGLTYSGTFKNGLLHGQGVLSKGNSWCYAGGFSYNSIHGIGQYKWLNGAFYNGQLYQGLPHGEGTMYSGDDEGCIYEGSWKHGLRHGQGKLTYGKDAAAKYEGWWAYDRKHGDGVQTYISGTTYKGTWLQGERSGKGRLDFVCCGKPPPCSYQAEIGQLSLVPFYVFEGEWMHDLASGRGKCLWLWSKHEETSDYLFNHYVGEFSRGMRHGEGIFYYASGALYKGEWVDNKKDGVGFYVYEDGEILSGNFVADKAPLESQTLRKVPFNSILMEESTRKDLQQVLLRHNSALTNIYNKYSSMLNGEICDIMLERPHAIRLEQLWQLVYDGKIVEYGLGLTQIDFLLRPVETSWNTSFEIHKSVDKFLTKHILPLLTKEEHSMVLLDLSSMESVFYGYALELEKLFYGTLREAGTSDDTMRLQMLDIFLQRFKPQWGLQRERLLSNLAKSLYGSELASEEDGAQYLNMEINYTEFQIALLIYATTLQDQGAQEDPVIMLNSLIKEAIVPNVSIDIEALINEEFVFNLPSINTKSGNGSFKNKVAQSVPGSRRATPKEVKLPAGIKSAPQTPLKKRL